jgi:hypothetical protein
MSWLTVVAAAAAARIAVVAALDAPTSVTMVQVGAGLQVTVQATPGTTDYSRTECLLLGYIDSIQQGWSIVTPAVLDAQDAVVLWFAPEGGWLDDGEQVMVSCAFQDSGGNSRTYS